MYTRRRYFVLFVGIVILAIAAYAYVVGNSSQPSTIATNTATSTVQTYGMKEYTDSSYGFTFWYPASATVTVTHPNSITNFPGGIDVERLDIGPLGGVYISVVQSASSTITDEPNGHAAPIAQTNYFYDASSGSWMVAYPEGTNSGTPGATTTADISKMTVAGLPMLPGGARFDTTIIPLSPARFPANTTMPRRPMTEFLVVQDGGGGLFTRELAATIAPIDAAVDPSLLSSALKAESVASAGN